MRALLCRELGPADRLALVDLPDPEPGAGEVVVDVHTAGLNFLDTLVIEGNYQAVLRIDPRIRSMRTFEL